MVFQHCWRKFCFIFFNLILRSLSIPKSSYFGSEFWPVSQLIALFVISNLNRTRQRNSAHKIEKIISWQKSFTNFWILGIPEQITWTRLRQKYKLNIDEKRISHMLIVVDYDIVRKTVLELHTRRSLFFYVSLTFCPLDPGHDKMIVFLRLYNIYWELSRNILLMCYLQNETRQCCHRRPLWAKFFFPKAAT